MPASLVRLRIAGFKSFAEPATVDVLPGLTGIVGPNGCGKSNVVEALRWAMGESSAKSLRGGEMDDVIFAGTAARASRNLAEVSLSLEGAVGLAPPPHHEQEELQVSRRIERGGGSTYRMNGREVRARDVQTLFADLASGARSSAMVSQGRVGALVNARPDDRRAVLEEAAGITGLATRRAEAEGKLRAAEANLARADDLRGQLEAQLAGLKRQARQAARWRNLSGLVRDAEGELLSLQRARAEAARAQAAAAYSTAQGAVAEATAAVTRTTAEATEAAAALPAIREREAETRTALERARLAREGVAAEATRAREALAAATSRHAQASRDLGHAEQASRDAATADTRLAAEAERLDADLAAHPAQLEAARLAAAQATEAMHAAETAAHAATERAAELTARAAAATQALQAAQARHQRLSEQRARLAAERARALSALVDPAQLQAAQQARQDAQAALEAAGARQETAEAARPAAHAELVAARDAHARADAARTRIAAEANALREVLGVRDGERWPPMVDALQVPPGLEAALGALLGEELAAAADRSAARHWRELPPFDALDADGADTFPTADGVAQAQPAPGMPARHGSPVGPPVGTRLSDIVGGPPALARALQAAALVEADTEGDAAQPALRPGQALVSRAGAVWRWDGYTIRAGAPTAAAVRLRQRNRLAALREELAGLETAAAEARTRRTAAEAAERAAVQEEQQARAARRDAAAAAERAAGAASQMERRAAEAQQRLAALDDQLGHVGPEADDAAAALEEARRAHDSLPPVAELRAEVDRTRAALQEARKADATLSRAADALAREGEAREARRRVLVREREDWRLRAADAAGRLTDLHARVAEAEAERARLAAEPDRAAAKLAETADTLEGAETAHRRAADALQAAVTRAESADRAARKAEGALSAAREAAARSEGVRDQADAAWGVVAERILERLGPNPALPAPPADHSPEAEERARRKLDRLNREREEMGPVNLRAELEAKETEDRAGLIEREQAELGTAIAKLRGSIGHLNREGRERLGKVFQEVDRHFQALFTRMFGGGRAHLAMVGSDDPLQAGLEIYAQPPGKKLATLSLLSGGEQALTALSLVFAVFRCTPAPVCVLDEVDAPLDDANVERFCALLEDMVQETGTRFLVVTHHALTMARMDRLYGVTMQERGVSRLLSVDLRRASEMVEQRDAPAGQLVEAREAAE